MRGYLKRRIDNQYAIEFREGQPFDLLEGEAGTFEIVERDNVTSFQDLKPQAQKDAETAAIIAELKQQAKDLKTAMTVEAIQFRATIQLLKDQFNDLRAAVMYLRTNGNTVALNATAVHAMFAGLPNLPPLDNQNIATGYTNKVTADVGNID